MTTALVSAKHKSFAIPYDLAVANLLPNARCINHGGNPMLLVPHTRETTRLARNLGYATPAPILTQYDWAGDTPFRIQKVTSALLTMHPRAFVLNEMGTGKTRAVLHAVNYMMLAGEIKRVLVVAPLSTLVNVWDNEIFRYFGHFKTGILHGSRAKRLERLKQDCDIYIINHDGVETILKELLARVDIDCVVVDELGFYRNARTDRWKALASVVAPRSYAWGLTGSPTPNGPDDAWGQIKLLSPARVPKFSKQFKRSVMNQVSQFRWVARPEAKQIVHDAMQPAVRYRRDDCMELPETIYQNRPVNMSTRQVKVYKDMISKLSLAFQEGKVTAVNEGVLFSKLLQIASGYVYTSDKKVVALGCQDRMDNLIEILDGSEGKVIVFVSFIHAANEVYNELTAKGYSTALVTGAVPTHARNKIFTAFQNSPQPRVLVAHPRCMSHGLTLTEANTIVWFIPADSLDTYQQACARITRPGQDLKTFIIHLTGSPIETKIYRRLQANASLQGALLEMFEGQTEA